VLPREEESRKERDAARGPAPGCVMIARKGKATEGKKARYYLPFARCVLCRCNIASKGMLRKRETLRVCDEE
jgi:hypothetical protein